MPADVEKIIIIVSRCFPREPAPFPGRFPFARAVLLSVVFLVCFFPVLLQGLASDFFFVELRPEKFLSASPVARLGLPLTRLSALFPRGAVFL